MTNLNVFKKLLPFSVLAILSACSGDDGADGSQGPQGLQGEQGAQGPSGADGQDGADGQNGADGQDGVNGNSAVYTVQVTNLTFAQPFSPVAVVMHEPGYTAFVDGEPATVGLEVLAEGGDNQAFIDEARASVDFLDVVSTQGPVFPKSISDSLTLVVPELDADNLRITVATMLINTNDAFTALNTVDISNMGVGEALTFSAPTWDSGTEANVETAETMPGPAAQALGAGGPAAGFDASREGGEGVVHFHRGVTTSANADDPSFEGLASSILTEQHRWDNPAMRVTVTRTR